MATVGEIEEEVRAFERELTAAIRHHIGSGVDAVTVSPGSAVVDLSANVDLVVTIAGQSREFACVTPSCLMQLVGHSREAEDSDIYATGGPLIVVRCLTPDAIARGILRFITYERLNGLTT